MKQPDKRFTPAGRWLPLVFFVWNIFSWVLTGWKAAAHDLLWLAAIPLTAIIPYLYFTRKKTEHGA